MFDALSAKRQKAQTPLAILLLSRPLGGDTRRYSGGVFDIVKKEYNIMAQAKVNNKYAALAKRWTPRGWTVSYRKSLTGRCYYQRKLIETPKPITLRALHIFLHECGHAYLHTGKERPKHRVEFEAETWAFKKMRDALIEPHPTSIERAKRYVRRKINQAVKRGAKWIDVEAAQWSEYENA